ncbi:MAG TPA: alpha/beta hydrolase, partial [Cyclobacteriaceae bacterium]|nr:alpha/beta hydrolase [Cyclobacteriaceae bacterium]
AFMSDIHHRVLGAGQPVVLLHGFCETNQIWGVFANLLSQHCQLLIPDLPGFGQSKLPPTPFSIDQVGERMWHWLDSLNIKKPVIVGHSLGGYVTLAMTHQRPNDVSGFSLFHSTAKPDTEEKKLNRDKVIAFVNKNGVAPFIETYVPGLFYRKDSPSIKDVYPVAYSTTAETLVAYASAMRDRPNRRQVLEDFERPVLIIAGEKDEIIPLDTLMDQAIQLRKGRLSILSDTGHMGMLESTSRSVEIVTQFVGTCAGV